MKKSSTDSVLIYDCSSRRKFIRTGTAFLLATGSVTFKNPVFGDECDRARDENTPKQPGDGSDSDSGSGSDPAGCGRQKGKPEITKLKKQEISNRKIEVAKVIV